MYICNVMRRKLLIHLTILAFFLSSACAYSQNNPLKVNDALYAYVRLVQNNLKVPSKGLLMVDTLFNRAKKLGDKRAQCLALSFRVKYYYNQKDYEKERAEFKRISPFILATPYHEY